MIKHLISLKIQNMMHIKGVLLQWFINFLIKRLHMEQLKIKLCLTSSWELMDPRKNDSDNTQDIRMPYVGNGYV